MVFLVQLLSLLNQLNWVGLLLAQLVTTMVTIPFIVKFGPSFFRRAAHYLPYLKAELKNIATSNRDITILGVAALMAMTLGAYLILRVPPNTNDSYLYHLARVAFWLQQRNLDQFYTPNLVKVIHPFNAEIGLLWLVALWGSDLLTGFLQWFGALFTMVAIYGIGRQLQFSRPASLFAALIWDTFIVVVAQSTSTKNDIIAAFFVATTLFFLLAGFRGKSSRHWVNLILAGVSFGLAVGTKSLAFLALAGLGLMVGWLALTKSKPYLRKSLLLAAWCSVGFLLLGSYNYVLDCYNFGSPFGPQNIGEYHTIEHPSLTTLGTNLGRISYQFVDPTGLPAPVTELIQQWRPFLGKTAFTLLHLNPNMPGTSWGDATFDFADDRYFVSRDGLSWYGPLAALILLPSLLYQFLIALFIKPDIWRWFVALTAIFFLVAVALVIRWQPYMGRYLMIGVTLGAPLMAGFYDGFRNRPIVRWVAVLLAIWILGWSATHNFHRPLLGNTDIFAMDYYDLRAIERPYMAPAYRYIDQTIPQTARLGVAGDWLLVSWDYLLFGPTLQRTVTHLNLNTLNTIDADTFAQNNIDYLILSASMLEKVESRVPLWPITNTRVEWYLAKHSEAEAIAAGQSNPDILKDSFGHDYQSYLKIKTVLKREPQPVNVLTTDPRMPYYKQDSHFEFGIPQHLEDFRGFTHLVVARWWTSDDFKRLNVDESALQQFLSQDEFVKLIFETDNYSVYRIAPSLSSANP